MALVSEVKYEYSQGLKGLSPGSVVLMLEDVRACIGRLDNAFAGVDLMRVLSAVEAGKYEVPGFILTRIDLSSVRDVVRAYRRHSEGGCISCVNRGMETIDAQDASVGFYCKLSDPDYDTRASVSGGLGVRYEGFSQKVNRHYLAPCEGWKPRFPQKLEELIRKVQGQSPAGHL